MRLLRLVAIVAITMLTVATIPYVYAKVYRLNHTFSLIPTADMKYAKVYGNVQVYLPALTLKVPVIVIKIMTWKNKEGISVVKVLSAYVKDIDDQDEIINILKYEQVSLPVNETYEEYKIIRIVYVPFGFYTVAGPVKAFVELPNGTLLVERDLLSLETMNVLREFSLNPMFVNLGGTSRIIAGHVGNLELVFYGKVYAYYIERVCKDKICKVRHGTLLNFTMYIPLSEVKITREGYKVILFTASKAMFAKEFISALLRELSIVLIRYHHCNCHCCFCHHASLCSKCVKFEETGGLWHLAAILEHFVNSVKRVSKILKYIEDKIDDLECKIKVKYKLKIESEEGEVKVKNKTKIKIETNNWESETEHKEEYEKTVGTESEYEREYEYKYKVEREGWSVLDLLHIHVHLYAGWIASAGDVLMIPISQMLCLYTDNAPVSSCSYENGYYAALSGFETRPYYKTGLAVALLWYYGHVPCYWIFIPFIGFRCVSLREAAQKFAIHVLREICSTADEVLNVSVGNMKGQICIWYIEEGKLKVNLLLNESNNTPNILPNSLTATTNSSTNSTGTSTENNSNVVSSVVIRQLEVNVTSPIFGQRMLEFNITNHTVNRLIKLVVRLQLENLPQSGAPVNVNVTIIPESENLIPEVVTSSSIVPNVTLPSVAESCSSVVEGNIVKILCKVNVTESNTILVIPPRNIYLTFRLENTDSANYKMVLNVEVNGSEREIGRSIDVLKLSGNVLANVTFNRLTIMINLTNVPSDIRYILSSNYVKAVLRCSNFGLIAPAILSDRFIIVNLPLVPELLTLTSNRCIIKLVANTTGKVLLKYRVNIVPLSALVSSVRINGRNVILTFSRPVENITIAGADCREGRKCVLSGIRTVIMPKSVKCGENTICVPTPLKIATLIR